MQESTDVFGYLNPETTHNFECNVADGQSVADSDVEWVWEFGLLNEDSTVTAAQSSSIITSDNVL